MRIGGGPPPGAPIPEPHRTPNPAFEEWEATANAAKSAWIKDYQDTHGGSAPTQQQEMFWQRQYSYDHPAPPRELLG